MSNTHFLARESNAKLKIIKCNGNKSRRKETVFTNYLKLLHVVSHDSLDRHGAKFQLNRFEGYGAIRGDH